MGNAEPAAHPTPNRMEAEMNECKKKQIRIRGVLMRPLAVGHAAIFAAGGKVHHTSHVTALHGKLMDGIHFETMDTHYHLSTEPSPEASALCA